MAGDKWELKAVLSMVDKMTPMLQQVNKWAQTARDSLGNLASAADKVAGRLGVPFAMFGGLAAGFGLGAIKKSMSGFAEKAEEMYTGSLKLGTSAMEWQRLKYMADQTRVPIELMQVAMGKLNLKIAEAASGKNKELAPLFSRLGIGLRNAQGHMVSAVDVLPQLADAFVRNDNAAVRAMMGNALFGESWAELMPLLSKGGKGLDTLADRWRSTGAEVTEEEMRAGMAFAQMGRDLDRLVGGFQGAIARELLPIVTPLFEAIMAWAKANKAVVASGVKEYAQDLAAWLKTINFAGVGKSIKDFGAAVGNVVNAIGGVKPALMLLVVYINASAIKTVFDLGVALWGAAAAFSGLSASAYVAANAGLLAFVRTVVLAWGVSGGAFAFIATAWGALVAWVVAGGGIAATAVGLLSGAFAVVTGAVRALGVAMTANPLGVIIGIAAAAYLIYANWSTLKEWFGSVFEWLGEKLGWLLGLLGDMARAAGKLLGLDFGGSGAPAGVVPPLPGAAEGAPANGLAGNAGGPGLLQAQRVQAGGTIKVEFDNAPSGMRVAGLDYNDVPFEAQVGYRGFALGMP